MAGFNKLSSRGFTLIEVLVSLLILSILAATAWKGMDAMTRAREISQGQLQRTLRLQSVMAQWEMDVGAVLDTLAVDAFEFDGARMRMTRKAPGGVQVVVWTLRNGRMERWASPVVTQVGDLDQAWRRSYQLQGQEPGTLVALSGVMQWQAYCYRSGSWSNCQSSGDVAKSDTSATGRARVVLPSGVRAVLMLGEGSGFGGTLTRDVRMAPQPGGSR